MNSKWIKFCCPDGVEKLTNSLLGYPITSKSDFGFDVVEFDDITISARYFERKLEDRVFILPNGSEISSQATSIVLFDFYMHKISKEMYLICIDQPPRSLKGYLDKLTTAIDSSLYFAGVNIDILTFINELNYQKNVKKIKVRELSVSNLILNSENSADIKIKSHSNALNALRNSFPEHEFVVKNARLEFFRDNQRQFIKLSKTGTIDMPESSSIDILGLLKNSISY